MDITTAFDFERANDFNRRRTEHLSLDIGKRLRRRHNHAVAGVHAHGVDIFHIANANAIVVGVAHHFILNLFVAEQRFFDQHLPDHRRLQPAHRYINQFVGGICKAAAFTAESISGANDDGEADFFSEGNRAVNVLNDRRLRNGLIDCLHCLFEQIAILSVSDGIGRSAQNFHIEFIEHARIFEFDGKIQARLSAERRQQSVGAFLLNHVRQKFERQRLHINFVRGVDVGHNRRGVGIDQHNVETFVAQRSTRLSAGIIELRRLTNHNRTRTNYKDFIHGFIFRHKHSPLNRPRGQKVCQT